jgi:hypothetical protein
MFAILPLAGSSGSPFASRHSRFHIPYTDENAPHQRLRKYFSRHPLKCRKRSPFVQRRQRGFPCLGRGAKRWSKAVAKHNGVRVRPRAHDDDAGRAAKCGLLREAPWNSKGADCDRGVHSPGSPPAVAVLPEGGFSTGPAFRPSITREGEATRRHPLGQSSRQRSPCLRPGGSPNNTA